MLCKTHLFFMCKSLSRKSLHLFYCLNWMYHYKHLIHYDHNTLASLPNKKIKCRHQNLISNKIQNWSGVLRCDPFNDSLICQSTSFTPPPSVSLANKKLGSNDYDA
jgi:hypothetical protein